MKLINRLCFLEKLYDQPLYKQTNPTAYLETNWKISFSDPPDFCWGIKVAPHGAQTLAQKIMGIKSQVEIEGTSFSERE